MEFTKIEKLYQIGDFVIEQHTDADGNPESIAMYSDEKNKKVISTKNEIKLIKEKIENMYSLTTESLMNSSNEVMNKYPDTNELEIEQIKEIVFGLKDKIVSDEYVIDNILPKINKRVQVASEKFANLLQSYSKHVGPSIESYFNSYIVPSEFVESEKFVTQDHESVNDEFVENEKFMNEILQTTSSYATKVKEINSDLESDIEKILAEPTKKKSGILPFIFGGIVGSGILALYLNSQYVMKPKDAVQDLDSNKYVSVIDPKANEEISWLLDEIANLDDSLEFYKKNPTIIKIKGKDGKDHYLRARRNPNGDYSTDFDDDWPEDEKIDLSRRKKGFINDNDEPWVEPWEPDTVYVKVGDDRVAVRRIPGSRNNDYEGDFSDWAVDTVIVTKDNPKDKQTILELQKQIEKQLIPNYILVKGKDGKTRRVTDIKKTPNGEYTGTFIFPQDTVYALSSDPKDKQKISDLEKQLGENKIPKKILVKVPGKDEKGKNMYIDNIIKTPAGTYEGNLNGYSRDTLKIVNKVEVPVEKQGPDSSAYYKNLYKNKKDAIYNDKKSGFKLKINPNAKIYKSNGGK